MEASHLKKAGILTIILVVLSIGSWEMYLRSQGLKPSYDDGNELWGDKRAMVYEPANKATVFIGSSRNKYDIDIKTWQGLTGDHAIQLAIEGECPRLVLHDLGTDEKFKGKLIVDVTEGLFFSSAPNNNTKPKEHIEYYKKRTPAQIASFKINHLLESGFVFLDKEYFSLNAMLENLPIKKRQGVFALPCPFVKEFGRITFDRQNIMMDKFLIDTTLQNQIKGLWLFFDKNNTEAPVSGDSLQHVLTSIKNDVDKIRARGGEVLFVRTPSNGFYWTTESKNFPREKYWDVLLATTNSKGIHFKDYPAIANLICPEWSHLSQANAIVFTKNIIEILQKDKGWKFPNAQTTASNTLTTKTLSHGF